MIKDKSFLVSNGVNVDKSLELFGDMETYNASIQDFLVDVPEKLKKLKQYKEVSDMANYAILVHSLKSDARYFGFETLGEMAYQHEMESKANNMYYVMQNFDSLVAEANKALKITESYLGKEISVVQEPETQTVVKDKTILVVDDSNIVCNFIKKIFDDTYEVLVAGDGQEALSIIKQNMNNNKIVGMLLDLNMPNVDGFMVLDYFRDNGLFMKIPVSIITGEGSKEIIERAFQYPIVDVLNKPFNERDVKRIVETTLVFHETNV